MHFLTPRQAGRPDRVVPRPRTHNPCRVSHASGLASSAFARHYSRNHGCFLFLWVLRCFTSPRSLHTPYVFKRGSHHMTGAGFPHSEILGRSEEHTSELQSRQYLVCRLLLEKKKHIEHSSKSRTT